MELKPIVVKPIKTEEPAEIKIDAVWDIKVEQETELKTCTCDTCTCEDHLKDNNQAINNIKIEIFRNRSVMEARLIDAETGEITHDRLPVNWASRGNALDYLSVSKIKAYEDCPACFFHQYISDEKIEEDSGNFYTSFGTILHEVVEKASQYYMDCGIVVNPLTIYDEVWKNNTMPVDEDHSAFGTYLEGKKLIEDYFANNPIESRTDTTIFIEKEWRGELGGCTFGLMLDYAGVLKSDPTVGILKDYKSNRVPFTPSELDESFQLKIYEIILRKLRPDIKTWISGYEMFRFGWQQCPPRTQEDLDNAEQYVANIWDKISNDNIWEEKLNTYCGFRKCRFTCKAYSDYVADPKRYIDAIYVDEMDIASVSTAKDKLTTYEKIAKGRKDECSKVLKSAVEDAMKQNKILVIDGHELQLFSSGKQSYNYYDTKNTLLVNNALELLDKCLTIGKTKMDDQLIKRPDLKLALSQCMSTSYASPYIVKKKHIPKK